MRNKKMTATEERVYIQEIEKIQNSIDIVDELEELHNEYVILNNGLKGVEIKNLN